MNGLRPQVEVRADLVRQLAVEWDRLAAPGGSLTGDRRVSLARAAREGAIQDNSLGQLAIHLYESPATVQASHVRSAVEDAGDPATVETIGIIARLSAVDRLVQVVGSPQIPLPDPAPGPPTGEVDTTLKRRRGHVPMPPGPIPFSLNLVPAEGLALMALHGPLYMTGEEMMDLGFRRTPGLARPQMELIAARVSLINRCFY